MIQNSTRVGRSPKNQTTNKLKHRASVSPKNPMATRLKHQSSVDSNKQASNSLKLPATGLKHQTSVSSKHQATKLSNNILRRHSFNVLSPDSSKKLRFRYEQHAWPLMSFSFPSDQDREKQDQLNELLAKYSLNGLPPLPDLLALGKRKFNDQLLFVEDNWRDFVVAHETMSKRQQERQEAVWELLNTEVSYIRQISVIIDVFRNCLYNVQQEQFLNEIEMEKMFSNIDKIYDCNCDFWQNYMLPVLNKARETGTAVEPVLFKEGFVNHFQTLFQEYFKYFIEHKACLDYTKACQENSELFKIFITWAESQKQCNRLKMADILVIPMQRLLKYSLLLQAIQKHTECKLERQDMQEMIDTVDKVCQQANNAMRVREIYEKLAAVRKTIDPYDAIEAPNDECSRIIQEYNGNFTLLAPMPGCRDGQPRSLIFQSSLRMKEAQSAKIDVDILLFTDLILICKSNRKVQDRYKIIRPPMGLDNLVVSDLRDKSAFLLIYMNEYHVPISAFTFHADPNAVRSWLEKFREAQSDFKKRKVQESAELERQRCLAVSVEEEVEYTPLRAPLPSLAFPRSESVDSADHFLPNLMSPIETPNLSLPADLGRSGSASDLPGNSPSQRPQDSNAFDTDVNSLHRLASSTVHENPSERHQPVQISQSVPNFIARNHKNGNYVEQNSSQSPGKTLLAQANKVQGLDSSPTFVHNSTRHIYTQISLSEQHCAFDEDELSRIKLNSRRTSRAEKRYHTADSIQELKNQDKDSSIHKRLSWRTDVNVDRSLSSKVLSSDSVRSAPSSSGVSSTGSLHLNPESDISEEVEGRSGGVSTFKMGHPRLSSVGDNEDLNIEDYNGRYLSSDLNSESKHSKSKSTPDLLDLHINEMQDGIASVKVTTDGGTRLFTHADILKMKRLKHQILFDSEVESSEV